MGNTTNGNPARPAPSLGDSVLLRTLHNATVAMVAADAPDLSARQLAVLLTVYLDDAPQTVRGLAGALNVSKPAITRALDRLGELDLARRKVDPEDRRSVLVARTIAGASHVRRIEAALAHAAAKAGSAGR